MIELANLNFVSLTYLLSVEMPADEVEIKRPGDPWAAAAASKSSAANRTGKDDKGEVRSRSRERSGAAGAASDSRGGDATADGVRAGVDDFERMLAEAVDAGLQRARPAITVDVVGKVAEIVRPIRDECKANTASIKEHDARLEEVETRMGTMAKEMAEIKKLVAISDSKPTSVRTTPQKNADEFDKTVVRLSAHSLVGIDALRAVVADLLAAAEISASVAEVRGPDVGKQFRLCFNGESDTAGRRASKFLASLRTREGWKDVKVARPTGGDEKIFVSADRSSNEIRRDRCTAKLADLIQEDKLSVRPYKSKRDGTVSFQWQLLAALQTLHAGR